LLAGEPAGAEGLAEQHGDLRGPVRIRPAVGMTWSPMRMASMHNTITIHAVFTRS
jgi:hypothetical protein